MIPDHIERAAFRGMNKTPTRIELSLPWPNKLLSPNARTHWAEKGRAVKQARSYAWARTLEQLHGTRPWWTGFSLTWTFCPPSRRRYDMDNLIAQHKAAQDGIADALQADDHRFQSTYSMGEPVRGGCVRVVITGT